MDSIRHELELFLSATARKRPYMAKPLVLSAEFHTLKSVADSENRVFGIDMAQLESFSEAFDKQCKEAATQASS